ncbi:MAG: Ig-like domain-containing protein, partial [Deltaproteobacteria bacterium]
MITPSSANLNVGDKLTLVASVMAGPGQTRDARWTTANASVATVNATTGEVNAVGVGTTTIIATSVADTTLKGAAAITVGSILPGTAISVNQDGKSANLSSVSGLIDVVVGLPPAALNVSTAGLLLNFGGTDTLVLTQTVTAAMLAERSITLTLNTAAFKNGPCTLKAQVTTTTGTIVRSAGLQITLNNPTTASAASLRPEHLRDARLQRVQLLSQSLITLHRVAPDPLIHASG